MLASAGIFVEVAPDLFALTPEAGLLRRDAPGSMWQDTIFFMELVHPAWHELLYSVRTGGVAFDRVYGTSYYAYLAQNAEANALFNAVMTGVSRDQVGAIVATYDFPNHGTIVDIDGGQGTLLAAILRARPGARGILFDLPHVVESAPALLAAEGVAERCEVVGGDAFAAVPEGGDLYVMKWILENWQDGLTRDVLANCRRAMGTSGKLVAFDEVTPTELASRSHTLWEATNFDIILMLLLRGKMRTVNEYENLLKAAGFRVGRILPIAGQLSAIEGIPV
jgi:hypothetical protein